MEAENNKPLDPPKLFAGALWVPFTFSPSIERYQAFLEKGRPAVKTLLDGLILHEQVVVPTQDFLSLAGLIGVLGKPALLTLLDAGFLKFVRLKGAYAYIGNGGGIQYFEIQGQNAVHNMAFCCDMEMALAMAIEGAPGGSRDPRLMRKVLESTTEVDAKKMQSVLRDETRRDVLNSPYLKKWAALNGDIDRLPNIEPNMVRGIKSPHGPPPTDEIDVVMSLLSANLELRLSQTMDCADATTLSPIGHLLKAKAERSFGQVASADAFTTFREITDIPDVSEGALNRVVKIQDLVKLRETANGKQFRRWFHENCRDNTIETAKEYGVLLRQVPAVQSLRFRVLRFILTNALGLFPGLVGTMANLTAGYIDSFFIDGWMKGRSPKFFIEDLRQIANKSSLH